MDEERRLITELFEQMEKPAAQPEGITFDESTARCPMPWVQWDYATGDSEFRTPMPVERCDGELYLEWTFCIPITKDLKTQPAVTAAEQAVTHSWEVRCENGHVLATSSGEEIAEPFVPSTLWPGWPR
jgi:hypothetical protein